MSDAQDPLDFIKNMWGNMGFTVPGMVTPTLDTNELDKRINELKTVEGWLKTNLGMLQMTIQGLEMQRATLAAMRAMSDTASNPEANANPFANPALWQWPFMPQGDASTPAGEQTRSAASKPKADGSASKPRTRKKAD